MTTKIPDGFAPLETGGFFKTLGPWYGRSMDDAFVSGLLIEERHCNLFGQIHGGMLATMADMTLCRGIFAKRHHGEAGFPNISTLSLTVDYVGSARVGEWIEGQVNVLKSEGLITFAYCDIRCGKRQIAHASGVFRLK